MIDAVFSAGKYDPPIQFNTKATKGDLKKDIAALLTSYIKDLEANGASAEVVSGVTNFRRSCSYVLSNYLRGIHSNAFDNFAKGLAYLGIENSSLLSARLGKEVLFRGRVNQVLTDYGKDEMLHIPLNRRGVVTSQRYSFPGSSAGAGAGTGAGVGSSAGASANTRTSSKALKLDKLRSRLGERSLFTSDGKQYPYATSMFGLIELALLCEDFDFGEEAPRPDDLRPVK